MVDTGDHAGFPDWLIPGVVVALIYHWGTLRDHEGKHDLGRAASSFRERRVSVLSA
jgi:hypothetical protein